MIRNEHFSASFDTQAGTISIRRNDGTPFLTAGAACANTDAGKHSTTSPGREHSVASAPFSDVLGTGQRLTIDSPDAQKLLDLRVEVRLYDGLPMATIEARCSNV